MWLAATLLDSAGLKQKQRTVLWSPPREGRPFPRHTGPGSARERQPRPGQAGDREPLAGVNGSHGW